MSAKHTSFVWTYSQARGPHKLVLLALADHADRKGEAELSLRDMAALCGLSKTRIQEIIGALVESGELRVMDGGAGRSNPARYWITLRPDPAKWTVGIDLAADPDESAHQDVLRALEGGPQGPVIVQRKPEYFEEPTKVTDEQGQPVPLPSRIISNESVMAVLKAAKARLPEDQPFFWTRREHRDDLRDMLKRTGCTLENLCDRFQEAAEGGRGVDFIPTRLTQLEPMLGRKGAR